MARRVLILLLAACALAGCGDHTTPLPPQLRAVPIGTGPRFQPAAGAHATPGLGPCAVHGGARFGAHVELFAAGRVVVVPAGIGIRAPRREGAYVRGGRCSYPLRTTEPTGVIEVAQDARATLGDLFTVWGRALDGGRLLDFPGPVRAYVAGRPVAGDPRAIRLTRHAEIVLAVGPPVPVHPSFTFRAGL